MTQPAQPDAVVPAVIFHDSRIMKLFVEDIDKTTDARVLDVGLVSGVNVDFLAGRVKRLYICDMFRPLLAKRRKNLPIRQVLENLDYSPETFDGILLWDIIDRLEDAAGETLVSLCHRTVRPDGRLMMLSFKEGEVENPINAFYHPA